jgi:hypothetical protein
MIKMINQPEDITDAGKPEAIAAEETKETQDIKRTKAILAGALCGKTSILHGNSPDKWCFQSVLSYSPTPQLRLI